MAEGKRKRKPRSRSRVGESARKRGGQPPAPLPPVALVKQPHGGAIKQGGNPGNAGGSGRPPSALRDRLRGAMETRIPIIEQIADGEPIVRTEIPVISVLRHVLCPKCGGPLQMTERDPLMAMSITIIGKVSASPKDRISAIDLAAKYGLGVKDEISIVSADVVARLERQAARFVSELTPEALNVVRRIVDEVWQ
jgi:hypothetical protein